MLDFRMDTFLTVCKYMNFTKAAKKLHITQPAVSQHITFVQAMILHLYGENVVYFRKNTADYLQNLQIKSLR